MAKLKNLYDPKVIDAITASYATSTDEATGDTVQPETPCNIVTIKSPQQAQGSELFSKVFGWKPKSIPDIYIPVFTKDDWEAEAQLHIPEKDKNWVWNKRALESFALAMCEGDTTLLYGLQGTGKSCLAKEWCAVTLTPFWRMSCNRETRETHFLGSPGISYDDQGRLTIKQEPTILTDSLKYGGMFCEDEAFRHNSALVLQSLREKSTRMVVLPDAPGRTASERKLMAPKGRWWYVLTDNTTGSGDETGLFDAEVQDASTLDRIDACIEIQYLPKREEVKILKKHSDLDKDLITNMVNVANLIRSAFDKQTMMSTISVRGLLAWSTKIELMGHIGYAFQLSWYNKLGIDDRQVAEDIFHQVFAFNMDSDKKG